MRALAFSFALTVALTYAHGVGRAQEASAAGWLGVGAFGPRLATTVDVGLDLADDAYAVGIGARLRYLAGEGLREEDWDDTSELLRVIRYGVYERTIRDSDGDARLRVAAAAGALGSVVLGHGVVVDGYTTGVDVDHGRVGAQARVDGGLVAFEGLVDDIAAPRVVAGRSQWAYGERLRVGFSVVGDLSAPSDASAQSAPGAARDEILPFLVADGEYRPELGDERFQLKAYADLVSVIGVGEGAHLGCAGAAVLGRGQAQVSVRSELSVGSDRYLAGWIGPLYDLARASRLTEARAGGLGGLGGLAEIGLDLPRGGRGSISYAHRPGIADLVALRVAAPHLRGLQGAVWGAAELDREPDSLRALAVELRARLPAEMFVLLETAHLYRQEGGTPVPTWIATVAVGGVVGE